MAAPPYSFGEVMERRLAELRSQLAAEHELAVQQAVGQIARTLQLENARLRAEVEEWRQRAAAARPCEPDAVPVPLLPASRGALAALSGAEHAPGPSGEGIGVAFAELVANLYEEEELIERLTAALEDTELCRLYVAQRACRWCFREVVRAHQAPTASDQLKRRLSGLASGGSSTAGSSSGSALWFSMTELDDPSPATAGSACADPGIWAGGSGAPQLAATVERDTSAATRCQEDTEEEERGSSSQGSSSIGWSASPSLEQPVAAQPEAAGVAPGVEPAAAAAEGPAAATTKAEGLDSFQAEEPRAAAPEPEQPTDAKLGQPAGAAPDQPAAAEVEGPAAAIAETEEEVAPLPQPELPEDARSEQSVTAETEWPTAKDGTDLFFNFAALGETNDDAGSEPLNTDEQLGSRMLAPEPVLSAEQQQKKQSRELKKLLRTAKPSWTTREARAVQAKLGMLDIRSTADLAQALALTGHGHLNARLRERGLHPFTSTTLRALAQTLKAQLSLAQPVPDEAVEVSAAGADGEAAASNAESARAEVAGKREEEAMLGVWLCSDGRSSFEIRSLDDGGWQDTGSGAAHGGGSAGSTAPSGLWYAQRLPRGELVTGALRRNAEPPWTWKARLSDSSELRLRRKEQQTLLSFQRRSAGAADWEGTRMAERPQAYAFYNAYDHQDGFRFVHFPVEGQELGEFPMIGLTAGWLPATLPDTETEAAMESRREVKANLLGTFCDPFDVVQPPSVASQSRELVRGMGPVRGLSLGRASGQNPVVELARQWGVTPQALKEHALCCGELRPLAQPRKRRGLELDVDARRVRFASSGVPPRPLLSIICVRWYDYWSQERPSDYSILSDGFFVDVLNGPNSPGRLLNGDFEVFTVFIRHTSDLAKLRPEHLRAMLKGRNVSVWCFLWPNSGGKPGEVCEREFFRLCQAMERLPIRMGWPHPSSLYRLLCGKLWVPQMSLNRKYCVPATTRVHYAELCSGRQKAAERALHALMRLRTKVWQKPAVPFEDFEGVVKLGFSWCGSDVLPFRGVKSLAKNLEKLLEHKLCENSTCLVQEMVPNVVGEHRVLVMHDKERGSFRTEAMWMDIADPYESFSKHHIRTTDVRDFKMASHVVVEQNDVARRLFNGDRKAQVMAEEQARLTVDHWLRWYQTESPELPQCTRIDFLVSYKGNEQAGQAQIYTCEVGENGGSLCTVEVHGRNLAALNRAILQDDSGRFPMRFPAHIPRNGGEKG